MTPARRVRAGWWELWRPPVVGVAAVVLVAVGAAVLASWWRVGMPEYIGKPVPPETEEVPEQH